MPLIELLKPHTHAGQLYRPRERIELEPSLANWLVASGVARPILVSDPDRPPHARRRDSLMSTPLPLSTPSEESPS